ncbi:recombination regulator RecX [Clostridium tertium]|uniref:Regulatory protein RecX n=1 Tax=Clostridium tertium TaxID=1559 RepID=A0A6N3BWU4_9CLOT
MNTITKIEVQKRNKNRVNIYVDHEYAFSLDSELVYKEGLKTNESVNVERIEDIAKKDNYLKCKNAALRIVEKAYKSEKELKDKLILKGYDKHSIEKSIEFLKEYGFINDNNYAKLYIKDKNRTQGKSKIKYDLIRKGISEDVIESSISNIDDEDERDNAYNLAIKKYNVISKREDDKYKLSQKLYRFLLSKGYNYDTVSYVVKKITNQEDI